jgi:hypothetical protein
VSDLDAPRTQRQRHVDHVADTIQVLSMDHHVEGERETDSADRLGESRLLRVGLSLLKNVFGLGIG